MGEIDAATRQTLARKRQATWKCVFTRKVFPLGVPPFRLIKFGAGLRKVYAGELVVASSSRFNEAVLHRGYSVYLPSVPPFHRFPSVRFDATWGCYLKVEI